MTETRTVAYDHNGKTFEGYLADGAKGRKAPGILVAHEGPGLTEHPRARARMLAELGYVAFALDLYGEPPPPMERARLLVRELIADPALLRGRTHAALDCLKRQAGVDANRTAAIGFCFGGAAVLELARSGADVAAVVGFHARLATASSKDARNIKGKILICTGTADPIVTADQRLAFEKEMDAANVDWRMELYGGVGHSFTNPEIDAFKFEGFAYDEHADRHSWAAMRRFFDEVLGPVAAQ